MISLDDLGLGGLSDPRTRFIAHLLAQKYRLPNEIDAAIEAGGLASWEYPLSVARLAFEQAVADAITLQRLDTFIAPVIASDPAFGQRLQERLRAMTGATGPGGWYPCRDAYDCGFVGPGAGRAMIDRNGLRSKLYDLVNDDYRVLIVTGPPGSGKTHSWLLIDHLRQAGKLAGHKCVRISTHTWGNDEVTGEMVAQSLADRLGLDIRLTGSGELEDARARKILDMLVGRYPEDGITRWIVLDGLDRPRVHDSARDVARQLITMIGDGELSNSRLIITGFDESLVGAGALYVTETIPAIDGALVRAFLTDVAARLGHTVTPAELDVHVGEVLGGADRPGLVEIERAVVRLVKREWGPGGADGD